MVYDPGYKVEVAFVANPLGALIWTDVSTWCRLPIDISRGRAYELTQAETGTATLLLDNSDGRFDPTQPAPTNLLSDTDSSFEDGTIGGWFAGTGAPTLANATPPAAAVRGTKALKVTATATSARIAVTTTGSAVNGQPYTAAVWVYSDTQLSFNLQLWGTGYGGTTANGPSVTVRANTWTLLTQTRTATANGQVNVTVMPADGTTAVGKIFYVDAGSVGAGSQAPSPYAPYLLPMRPIRITSTYSGTTYNVFRGFIERWPQTWDLDGVQGMVTVTCVDGFATSLARTFGMTYKDTVLADSPLEFYRFFMNGTTPNTTANLGSDGASTGGPFGTGPSGVTVAGAPLGDPTTSVQLDFSGLNHFEPFDITVGPSAAIHAPVTCDVWVKFGSATTLNAAAVTNGLHIRTVDFGYFSGGLSGKGGGLQFVATATTPPTFKVQAPTGDNTWADTGYTFTADDIYRYFAWTIDSDGTTKVYVNAVLVYTGTYTGIFTGAGYTGGKTLARFDTTNASDYGDVFYTMDAFSITAGIASISKRYNAGALYTQFPAEDAGARIGHVLDAINWPTADRVIDTNGLQLQATGSVAGSTALSLLQAAAAADSGVVFLDAQGRFVFQSHAHSYPTGYVAAATFGEAGFPHLDDIQVGFDPQYVFNDVEVTQANSSPAYVSVQLNATSQTNYGIRSYPQTLPLASSSDVDAVAGTLLATYKQPHARIATVSLEGRSHLANIPQCLGREIGDVVTVTKKSMTGAPTVSVLCVVEGIKHHVDERQWLTTFQLSPAPNYVFWQIGDPVYGVLESTDVLAF